MNPQRAQCPFLENRRNRVSYNVSRPNSGPKGKMSPLGIYLLEDTLGNFSVLKEGSCGGGSPVKVSKTSCSLSRVYRMVGEPPWEEGQEVRCGEAGPRQGSLASKGISGTPLGI